MHPVIRIASFLVITISLAQLELAKLITAAIFLLLFYFIYPSLKPAKQTLQLVYRLRWLFISIIVIYAWFTPGVLLVPDWGSFSPYREGVIAGVMRVMALVVIIAVLSAVVLSVSRDDLINAIYWYCRPLKFIGINDQRVVVRLMLTMEYVTQLESIWKQGVENTASENDSIQNRYQRILQLFQQVIDRAESVKTEIISFSPGQQPGLLQWLVPLSILVTLQIV